MRGTSRDEAERKLDDDTSEANEDLGSFTGLQVGPRFLICATLRGLESEPTFDFKAENAIAMRRDGETCLVADKWNRNKYIKNKNKFLLFSDEPKKRIRVFTRIASEAAIDGNVWSEDGGLKRKCGPCCTTASPEK